MKFFSGFCIKDEEKFFEKYLDKSAFCVAGFSKGAQDALEYVLKSDTRIDRLQLFSPAFFDYSAKITEMNLKAFKKDKNAYIKNFLTKSGLKNKNGIWMLGDEEVSLKECTFEELRALFDFEWNKIKKLKNIKIEVYLGEFDKITASKKAEKFFVNYADVYFFKKANHFLRSE